MIPPAECASPRSYKRLPATGNTTCPRVQDDACADASRTWLCSLDHPPSEVVCTHTSESTNHFSLRLHATHKRCYAQIAHPLLRKRRLSQYPPVLLAMLDLTNLSSALEGPQDGGSTSMSTNSSYLRPPSASIHHCTTCCTLFSRSESSRNQSFLKSPRPLPIPPLFVPPLPILLTSSSPMPSSSTSSVTSTTSHLLPCHSRTIARPLPKMPKSTPSPLGTTRRGTSTEERSLPPTPTSPADLPESSSAPQQSANEIRRGNLQGHRGRSTPTDLVPPKLDAGELSDSPSSDEEQYFDPALALVAPEYLTKPTDEEPGKLVKRFSRRWLREKNGRRWVEENYDTIAQCLRELR